jgi:malonyl-ACP decarboxylase
MVAILQMREGRLHPARNLENPIEPSYNWVRGHAVSHAVENALNMSMGFGGVNSAVCLQRFH